MNYQLKNSKIQIEVSSLGAELRSVVKDGVEYLWNGNEEYWPDRSPFLFPFVGRFTEGKYKLHGQEYNMNIHGFARTLEYEVENQTDTELVLKAKNTAETFKDYPYEFVVKVVYKIQELTVSVGYVVENKSKEMMYFGIGGHPGFQVPLGEDLNFEDYYLEFSEKCQPERIGHTEDCFLNGKNETLELEGEKIYRLHHKMFDEDAIVLQHMADEVTLKSDKGSRSVTVSYRDFPYLGFWHKPETEAPYVCIEPWTSLPSRKNITEEFACKSDLIRLKAQGVYEGEWSITIK